VLLQACDCGKITVSLPSIWERVAVGASTGPSTSRTVPIVVFVVIRHGEPFAQSVIPARSDTVELHAVRGTNVSLVIPIAELGKDASGLVRVSILALHAALRVLDVPLAHRAGGALGGVR
jgi:hypothetical protein